MESQLSLEQIWIQQRERILAWLRVGFSLVAILVVYLHGDREPRFPVLYAVSRYSFLTYSTILLLLAYRVKSPLSMTIGMWTTWFDLGWVSVIDFGGGPGTPFFVYYLFPVITASSRYGVTGSLTVAVVGIALYSVMRVSFASYWSRPLQVDALVVRSIYLLGLAYVFGFLSEFEKKQNQRLMTLNKMAGEAAVQEERRLIAQDLHDRLLQVLASLSLRLEVCRIHLIGKTDEMVRELELMEKAAKQSLVEIRRYLSGKGTYDLAAGTLVDTLRQEMSFLRDGLGLRLVFETEPEDLSLSAEVEREIYLMLREGLMNVARHGHASRVEIALHMVDGTVQGVLVDDGIGFDPGRVSKGDGYGLGSMRDRIRRLNGEFRVESTPGRGTKISFRVPTGTGMRSEPRQSSESLA
jgi:signal transduction histidine kinase